MKPLDLAVLREAVAEERIQWRRHVLEKLAERGDSATSRPRSAAQRREDSGLHARSTLSERVILGLYGGKPLHVVAACDEITRQAFVITAYEPSLEVFESDYRTKKKL
jgi:hypothetical protein